MKLDTSHEHSEQAITAINKAIGEQKGVFHYYSVLELILTEWADDEDLLDISKFLENRLDKSLEQV
jgi:hypothetical protein